MKAGLRVAVALLCAFVVAGCGVRPERTARPLPAGIGSAAILTPHVPVPDQSGPAQERLFLILDARLTAVTRHVRAATPSVALQDLLAGPTQPERNRGFSTALPDGLRARLRLDRDVAVVALDTDLGSSGRSDEVLALAQVVSTLDDNPLVNAVRFEHLGQPLAVPRGDGSLTTGSVTVQDYADHASDVGTPKSP